MRYRAELDALNAIVESQNKTNELLQQLLDGGANHVRSGSGRGNTGEEQKLSNTNQHIAKNHAGTGQAVKKPRERAAAN